MLALIELSGFKDTIAYPSSTVGFFAGCLSGTKQTKIKSGVMSVLASSYCSEKRVELNLVMFSQHWERAQYFFSEVEKSVMHLVICLQELDLLQGITFLLSTSELILKFVISEEFWIWLKGKDF